MAVCAPGRFAGSADAVAAAAAGLGWLADCDVASMPAAEQGEVLRELEAAESRLTAARSAVLAGFTAGRGFEADGQAGARSWLRFQTRVSRGAAAAAAGWARRLAAHPAVRAALAAAVISSSWARAVCEWTDLLPAQYRDAAEKVLLAAAAGGADLADLAALAEEMRARTARPDADGGAGGGDGFEDRSVRLETTLGGAGRLEGDLTPQCAAALGAVLAALSKKRGPEDTRTRRQREHDALEEACRRLVAAGCCPDRAGQPTQIQLAMTLDQLLHLRQGGQPGQGADLGQPGAGAQPGVGDAAGGRAPTGPGYDCDAAIAPIVTGNVDYDLLARLTTILLRQPPAASQPDASQPEASQPEASQPTGPAQRAGTDSRDTGTGSRDTGTDEDSGTADGSANGQDPGHPGGAGHPGHPGAAAPRNAEARLSAARAREQRAGRAQRATADLILGQAIALLSGPAGLAAWLRRGRLTGPAASPSLPLDTGQATETIPAHLRRAVAARDSGHCAWPGGCDTPAAYCQVHHVTPLSQGGTTRLSNLWTGCAFHHLIAIHRWGWTLTLHADGTSTATSPDHAITLRSHSPPTAA